MKPFVRALYANLGKTTIYWTLEAYSMPTQDASWSSTLVRGILLVLAVLILMPLLLMMVMMPMMGMMGGMWGTGMTMSPAWGFGMMLLFLLVLVGIGYALYRAFTSEKVGPSDPALEELRVAYARGKLTQEEFEQRREDLERTG